MTLGGKSEGIFCHWMLILSHAHHDNGMRQSVSIVGPTVHLRDSLNKGKRDHIRQSVPIIAHMMMIWRNRSFVWVN